MPSFNKSAPISFVLAACTLALPIPQVDIGSVSNLVPSLTGNLPPVRVPSIPSIPSIPAVDTSMVQNLAGNLPIKVPSMPSVGALPVSLPNLPVRTVNIPVADALPVDTSMVDTTANMAQNLAGNQPVKVSSLISSILSIPAVGALPDTFMVQNLAGNLPVKVPSIPSVGALPVALSNLPVRAVNLPAVGALSVDTSAVDTTANMAQNLASNLPVKVPIVPSVDALPVDTSIINNTPSMVQNFAGNLPVKVAAIPSIPSVGALPVTMPSLPIRAVNIPAVGAAPVDTSKVDSTLSTLNVPSTGDMSNIYLLYSNTVFLVYTLYQYMIVCYRCTTSWYHSLNVAIVKNSF
ncbi:hypothetical protein D9758_002498 [Tetrapyrgos nigripes]|uniref:Uncharacterized protein n=1 Tax=Tetrapyrgos nigripes TaxID=182062 RepID=A0A8H5GQG5_9AGAR|nr:hypothetical protein D9758_002498 [Tetrapyrgos nigripes]